MSVNLPIRNLRYAATKLAFEAPRLRSYLLPLLVRSVVAKEFPSEDALKKYLKEHPKADRKQHTVSKPSGARPSEGDAEGKTRDRPKVGPSGWTEKDSDGNVFDDNAQVIGDLATVKDSQVSGKIKGNATVEGSETSSGSRISGNASVQNSEIKGLVQIKGDAKVSKSQIDTHNGVIEGDTEISIAAILGGSWNGQKVEGGRWEDSYDQDTIDLLSQFNDSKFPRRAGTGDGTVRAMAFWLADGGKTKGLLGKKKRKKLQKAIQEHMHRAYSGDQYTHAQAGGVLLEKLTDEDFDKLMSVAAEKSETMNAEDKSGKTASGSNLRRDLFRLASANPEIRPYVLPLLGSLSEPHKALVITAVVGSEMKTNSQISQTILEQMGGARRLGMMLGAKRFVSLSKGVSFAWPNRQRSKGNAVEITLRGDDTYDMEFFNVSMRARKPVKKYQGLYAEDLIPTFERQTGWRARMASTKLRADLIKLAHENPEIRPKLMPLLRGQYLEWDA